MGGKRRFYRADPAGNVNLYLIIPNRSIHYCSSLPPFSQTTSKKKLQKHLIIHSCISELMIIFFFCWFDRIIRVTLALARWNRFIATTNAARKSAASRWCSTRPSSAESVWSPAAIAQKISVTTRYKPITPNAVAIQSLARTNAIRPKLCARNSNPIWKTTARLWWSRVLLKRPDVDSR